MNTRSIGFRLTAWYSAIVVLSLATFSIGAWFAMRASLFHAVDDELRDRVRGVRKFMLSQIGSLSIPEIRDEFREHSILGPGGDLFQVCDVNGNWLYRSVPLENNRVAIGLPGNLRSPVFETRTVENTPLRFYSEGIVVNGAPYTIQVASSISELYEALGQFRWMLAGSLPLILLAAGLGGHWLSKRALAPVDRITQAARRIEIESLSERLTVSETGDELQRLSETLNDMLGRLSASVRRMQQFTADASHELRAPVALIRTASELTLRRERESGEYKDALRGILHEAKRTSDLVNHLMLLARADARTDTLYPAAMDLSLAVRKAAEQGRPLAESRSITLTCNADEPIEVNGDARALGQLLFILLDNAVKYTPEGGQVSISTVRRNGSVCVSVTDTGMGIGADDLPHIFDRFWRADKARSRGDAGSGLGLSIAKWIAEQHGGSIEVRSAPDAGSTFTLALPDRAG